MADVEDNKQLQDLASDLAVLREDLLKLSGSVRELVQDQAVTAKRRLTGAVDDARQKFSDEVSDAKDHLESHFGAVTADLESTIARSPLLAVLIGAAIGFLLGLASRSNR